MNNTRRRTETFLVVGKDQTTTPAAPTQLYDPTTLATNLNVGQLGIISVSPIAAAAPNTFIDTTPTVTEYPVIQLVQRTNINQPYPLGQRMFEYSAPIEVDKIESVVRLNYALGSHDVWSIGSVTPVSNINVKDNETYQINIAFTGRDVEYFTSCEQAHMMSASIKTPDFTALSTPNPVDWIVKHLVFQINTRSKAFSAPKEHGNHPVVAFAVTDGGTGGVAISSLTPGQSVPVFVYGTATQNLVVTAEMVAALQNASTKTGFTRLLLTDLTTAGNSTPNAKGILLMALDRDQVFDDRVIPTKNYLRVGLPYGFSDQLYSSKVVNGHEGHGYGLQYYKLYEKTHGQRKYAQSHDMWPIAKYPNPVDKAEKYTVFTVNHYKVSNFGHSTTTMQPMKEYILIPSKDHEDNDHPMIATLQARFNSLLASAGKPPVIVFPV